MSSNRSAAARLRRALSAGVLMAAAVLATPAAAQGPTLAEIAELAARAKYKELQDKLKASEVQQAAGAQPGAALPLPPVVPPLPRASGLDAEPAGTAIRPASPAPALVALYGVKTSLTAEIMLDGALHVVSSANPGQTLGDWRMDRIEPHRVTLSRKARSGRETLTLYPTGRPAADREVEEGGSTTLLRPAQARPSINPPPALPRVQPTVPPARISGPQLTPTRDVSSLAGRLAPR